MAMTSTNFNTFTAAVHGGIGYITGTVWTMTGTTITTTNSKATSGSGGLFYKTGSDSDIKFLSTTLFTN